MLSFLKTNIRIQKKNQNKKNIRTRRPKIQRKRNKGPKYQAIERRRERKKKKAYIRLNY
jgi:hypothetical protein